MADYSELMGRFRDAYVAADAAALTEVLAPGFEWHLNWFPADQPSPTGNVLHGVDEMVDELRPRRRRQTWTNVRYRDLNERFAVGLVVQTFTISGINERGMPFEVAAVDLYPIVDDRIAKKDTYWKHQALVR